jgi:GNAT superfamily N-acetyltransferase
MLTVSQVPFTLRRADITELSHLADLRLSSILSLEMPRHSLAAIKAVLAAVPDVDAALLASGRYVVAEREGDLIGGAGWSVLPLQFRSDRIVHEDGGTAFVSLDADSVLLRGFFLDPDLGRRGVGAALLRQIEADAAEQGYSAAEAIVPADAQLLYRSLGFRPVRKLAVSLDSGEAHPVLQMRKAFACRLAAAA